MYNIYKHVQILNIPDQTELTLNNKNILIGFVYGEINN